MIYRDEGVPRCESRPARTGTGSRKIECEATVDPRAVEVRAATEWLLALIAGRVAEFLAAEPLTSR